MKNFQLMIELSQQKIIPARFSEKILPEPKNRNISSSCIVCKFCSIFWYKVSRLLVYVS